MKFRNLKKIAVGTALAVVSTATASIAAMSTADETAVLAGIAGADTLFYKIGGAVLVVMAGIWAFKKVRAIL